MAGPSPQPVLLTAFLATGLVVLVGTILTLGAPLVVPVVEAVVVWFVLNALADGLQRVAPSLPRAGALVLAFFAMVLAGGLVVGTVAGGAADLGGQVAGLAGLVDHLGTWAEQRFGIPAETLASRAAGSPGLEAAVRMVVAATAATVAQAGLVSVYVLFYSSTRPSSLTSSARSCPTRCGGRASRRCSAGSPAASGRISG